MTLRWMRFLLAAAVGIVLVLPGGIARADHWQDRVAAGNAHATNRGTTIAIAWLDRATGQYRDNGAAAHTRIESASVMKVFIAEHLLHRQDLGHIRLSATDMNDMAAMLRDSANAPANRFWSAYGANTIVRDVIQRYGLGETGLTSNTRYWGNTLITAHDMAVFYRGMMNGAGGLSAGSRDWIVAQMRQSTMYGDGGRQFFGLHDGLPREQVIAQKQGWMCCVNGDIFRHSTGFTGPDDRFVLVVLTREPSGRGGAHIEESISGAVRAMFPEGLVPRVQGATGERWYRMGGAWGRLGYPVGDEMASAGGALARFQGGTVYWSPSTDAHPVWGAILEAYGAHRWEQGRLGFPTSDEVPSAGGALSRFQRGVIYWSPSTGAWGVWGAILETYGQHRWEQGRLGFPTSSEIPSAGGALGRFQRGTVYWSPATGAHAVWGAILETYGAHRWEQGRLGFPTSGEVILAGGALGRFQGGNIYWSPATGAHAVQGDVLEAYGAHRWEQGPLGYPVGGARSSAGGTRQDFQGGTVHSSTHGTYAVQGDILEAYRDQGGEAGSLGFPVGEAEADGGGMRQEFEGGTVTVPADDPPATPAPTTSTPTTPAPTTSTPTTSTAPATGASPTTTAPPTSGAPAATTTPSAVPSEDQQP